MGSTNQQRVASLYEITDYISQIIRHDEERQILCGLCAVAGFLEVEICEDIFGENSNIANYLLSLVSELDNNSYKFSDVNKDLTHIVQDKLNNIDYQKMGNSRAKLIFDYVAPRRFIQNKFRHVGSNFEGALRQNEVRRAVKTMRSINPNYSRFMLTVYKGKGSLDKNIVFIIQSEIKQIDQYFRRYLI